MNHPMNCRRKTATAAALGALLVLGACAKATSPGVPGATGSNLPEDFRFRVSGLPEAQGETTGVLAEHGIDFRLEGGFEVGPAPNGQVHQDSLPEKDRQVLQEAWTALRKSGFTATERCGAIPAESTLAPLHARVSILKNDRESALIRLDGGQLCGPADATALSEFSKVVVGLARKHYPKRFPSECLAEGDELRNLHESLLSCETDDECANVNGQYDAIPKGEVQFVALRSCSVLPRLAGANAALVSAGKKSLLAARAQALKACQAEDAQLECTTEIDPGFQNHRHPARCVSKKCVAGQTLH